MIPISAESQASNQKAIRYKFMIKLFSANPFETKRKKILKYCSVKREIYKLAILMTELSCTKYACNATTYALQKLQDPRLSASHAQHHADPSST